jgi:hypothetical protein
MDTIPFDTHAVVKDLVAAGFTEQQAEAQVQALLRLVHEQFATKRDVEDIRRDIADARREIGDVRRETESLRVEMKRDIKDAEMRITIRMGTMLVVLVGVLTAIMKLL